VGAEKVRRLAGLLKCGTALPSRRPGGAAPYSELKDDGSGGPSHQNPPAGESVLCKLPPSPTHLQQSTAMKHLLPLLALALLFAAAPLRAADLDKVSLQLNWLPEPEFGGIYAAQQAGIFAKHGLDVTILKGGPDVPAVPMAVSGKVEFA